MKNILIPTDFTIKSLKLIQSAIECFEGELLTIHLVYALEPDDSISGLLFLKKRLNAYSLYDDTFLQACEMLKNRHASSISRIHIEFYMGTTKWYRKHFLNARKIDAVFLPEDYTFKRSPGIAADPAKLWQQGDVPVIKAAISSVSPGNAVTEHSVAELLPV